MTEWDLAYMRRKVEPQGLTDADLDRIADAVPVDTIGVHITTWHRRFARAVLAAQPAPVPTTEAHDVASKMREAAMTFHLGMPHAIVMEQMTRFHDLVCMEATIKAATAFAAPVPVPFTKAQLHRLYVNSPEHHKDAPSEAAFTRIVQLAEAAHGIAASPEVTK